MTCKMATEFMEKGSEERKMSERAEFDVLGYMTDGVICLENMKIEDCIFKALQAEWKKKTVKMKNCTFENVTFDNQCGRGYAEVSGCEFVKCSFTGTLGKGKIIISNSLFSECLFEDFHIYGVDRSRIFKSKFSECTIQNVDLMWSFGIRGIEIDGGIIKNSRVAHAVIIENIFSNLCMEDIEMIGNYDGNKMDDVKLKNVVMSGKIGEKKLTKQENVFDNCNTEEFILLKDNMSLEVKDIN